MCKTLTLIMLLGLLSCSNDKDYERSLDDKIEVGNHTSLLKITYLNNHIYNVKYDSITVISSIMNAYKVQSSLPYKILRPYKIWLIDKENKDTICIISNGQILKYNGEFYKSTTRFLPITSEIPKDSAMYQIR
jgi:hypothetical protein